VVELTTNKGLREHLAKRIRCVIVDEYQDLNPIQEAVVWSLHELGARLSFANDTTRSQIAQSLPAQHTELRAKRPVGVSPRAEEKQAPLLHDASAVDGNGIA
jgi:hypothetical protein